MHYRLIVLTHGAAEPLRRTLDAFAEHVTPRPIDAYIYADGADAAAAAAPVLKDAKWTHWKMETLSTPIGFCEATARCWQAAAQPGADFVYWLEHDFVHLRPVSLDHLALVLLRNARVAQMALLRNAVSDEEGHAGGVIQSRGVENFEQHTRGGFPWLEHGFYWTTNPSLFKSSLTHWNHWPRVPGCEGHFHIELQRRRPGTSYGIWGSLDDPPLVEHIGARTGFGY